MDKSLEWAMFCDSRENHSHALEQEQEELIEQAQRLIKSTAAALKQVHNHQLENGVVTDFNHFPSIDLMFWLELALSKDDQRAAN